MKIIPHTYESTQCAHRSYAVISALFIRQAREEGESKRERDVRIITSFKARQAIIWMVQLGPSDSTAFFGSTSFGKKIGMRVLSKGSSSVLSGQS